MAGEFLIEHVRKCLPIGALIRRIADHTAATGSPIPRRNDPVRFIVANAEGVVTSHIAGYPEHDCLDHRLGLDECTCGDPSGRVEMSEAVAVVDFEAVTLNGDPAPPAARCVYPCKEGEKWERIT